MSEPNRLIRDKKRIAPIKVRPSPTPNRYKVSSGAVAIRAAELEGPPRRRVRPRVSDRV